MLKKDLVLGIDIGSHSLKVCQLKNTSTRPQIMALGSVLLPPDAVSDGNLEQPDAVASALSNLLKNLKVRNKKIGFSVSGYSVIVKKINLPVMSPSELEEYINTEAEQYIPFDIDDVYLDYQDLSTARNDNDRTDIMLVAAKKEVVDEYLQMFASLKLTPVIIDIDGFAFENSYHSNHSTPEDIALIDIGASTMTINILANGISTVARDILIGSNQLTYELADMLDVDFNTAEAIKIGAQQVENRQAIAEAFSATCSQWVLEIKKAIDHYQINNPKRSLKRIILGGGGSKTTGLTDYISQETGLSVERFSPFSNLHFNRKKLDPDYLNSAAPQMAIAAGIALRNSVI